MSKSLKPKPLIQARWHAYWLRGLAAMAVFIPAVFAIANPAFAVNDSSPSSEGATVQNTGSAAGNIMAMTINSTVIAITLLFRFIDQGTYPVVNEKGGWFTYQYATMVQVGIWVLLPILLISIIHATAKGSMQMLMRSMLVYLPISIIGSVVAISMVQLLIEITDDMCDIFTTFTASDLGRLNELLVTDFLTYGLDYWIITGILAILMICASISLMVILVLREASIYIATLFLPLGFAMLVWPGTSKHLRRLVEFLIAIILSKLIIVASISMAVASIVGADGEVTTGEALLFPQGSSTPEISEAQQIANTVEEQTASGSLGDSNEFASAASLNSSGNTNTIENAMLFWRHAITGLVFMGIASFSPAMLKGIVSFSGIAGEAAATLGVMLQRPIASPWILTALRYRGMGEALFARGGVISNVSTIAAKSNPKMPPSVPTHEDNMLAAQGFRQNRDGTWFITEGRLMDAGIDPNSVLGQQMQDATNPNRPGGLDFNQVQTVLRAEELAHELQAQGRGDEIQNLKIDFGEARQVNGQAMRATDYTVIQNTRTGETEVMLDGVDRRTGGIIREVPPAGMVHVNHQVRNEIASRTDGAMHNPTNILFRAAGRADPIGGSSG